MELHSSYVTYWPILFQKRPVVEDGHERERHGDDGDCEVGGDQVQDQEVVRVPPQRGHAHDARDRDQVGHDRQHHDDGERRRLGDDGVVEVG